MTDDVVNTGNLQGKVGYKNPPTDTQFGGKRANPINRQGRILSGRDALRREWEKVWAEVLVDEKGKPIMDDVTNKKLTRLKAQMRAMTTSTNVRKVELALAYTYGKPETPVQVTGADGGALIVEIIKASEDTNKNE